MRNTIAIVDPASFSLPYDFFYIKELSNFYDVDFYCSVTKYNYEYIELLKSFKGIHVIECDISSSVVDRVGAVVNYFKVLYSLYGKRNKYLAIHFIWSILFPVEIVFFWLLRKKLFFTFHNDSPHDAYNNVYWPYKVISLLARRSLFVSEYTMRSFVKKYQYTKTCYLIQHGIMPVSLGVSGVNFIPNEKVLFENKLVFWGRVSFYKGVDFFTKIPTSLPFDIEIIGKWDKNMASIKDELIGRSGVTILDSYISLTDLEKLLSREVVFVLPYISATQSGVLYTFLAHSKVFVSTDVGENGAFLRNSGLGGLLFDRDDFVSFYKAFEYASQNYWEIKMKLLELRARYEWSYVMRDVVNLYDT